MYGVSPDPAFPPVLGIRMRLTPEISRLTNLSSVAKATRLRKRQQAFCQNIVRITSWEISQLDFADKDLGCTLRQILMSLRSTEPGSEHLKLFFAVEHRYWMQDGGFVFLVLPIFEQEARMTIAGLLPYLKFLAKEKRQPADRIEGFFTTEAVARMAGAFYDPTRREVISEDEAYLDDITTCAEDMHFDLTEMLTDKASDKATATISPSAAPTDPGPSQRPSPPTLAVGNLLDGADSVTTFHTKTASKVTTQSTASKKSTASTPAVSSDTQSSTNESLFTEDDRKELRSLQDATKQTSLDIASIKSDISSLVSALAKLQAPQVRQPTESASPITAGQSQAAAGDGLQ